MSYLLDLTSPSIFFLFPQMEEKNITNKRSPRINVFSRITKNSAQFGNLHCTDNYDSISAEKRKALHL